MTTTMFAVMLAIVSVGTWMCKGTSKDIHDAIHLGELVSFIPKDPKIVQALMKALEGYADEHILLREQVLAARALFLYKVLACSGRSCIVVGHHGWLYYLAQEEGIDRYKGGFFYHKILPGPLTQNELYAWNHVFEKRRAWLAKRGIKYLLVVVPDKETIYPENYPAAYADMKSMNYLGQLKDYMSQHSKVDFVDLRQALIAAKPYTSVYYPRDSHWTKIGAFTAYCEIMKHLKAEFPTVKPLSLSDFELRRAYRSNLDLASGIGLGDIITDDTVNLVCKHALPLKSSPIPLNLAGQSDHEKRYSRTFETTGGKDLRILMFTDSFGRWLQPFFFQTAGRVTVQWCYLFPPELIEYDKPDIVIQEIVERNLKSCNPFNPRQLEEQ